ncbi:hypothetical protein FQN53_003258 [Emmonsiellopsis sp. PD_33]|nr:hypothetical protein FQN53_003258 [Emmonsiellopsis sp. PD_33]
MRSIIYLAVSALAAVVAAQDNAFNVPKGGYEFEAGKPTSLSWEPSTDGTVSLRLQKGDGTSFTAGSGMVIVENIPNSGSYTFTPSAGLGPGSDYTIQIIDDENPENFNFTPAFSVDGTTGTATALPTATGTTTKSESSTGTATTSATTSGTATTLSTTTSTSASTTSSTASTTTTSAAETSATGEPTSAPDPNGAMSVKLPGSMLTAVLALMAFL